MRFSFPNAMLDVESILYSMMIIPKSSCLKNHDSLNFLFFNFIGVTTFF